MNSEATVSIGLKNVLRVGTSNIRCPCGQAERAEQSGQSRAGRARKTFLSTPPLQESHKGFSQKMTTVCIFFLSVKFGNSLLASLAGGKRIFSTAGIWTMAPRNQKPVATLTPNLKPFFPFLFIENFSIFSLPYAPFVLKGQCGVTTFLFKKKISKANTFPHNNKKG